MIAIKLSFLDGVGSAVETTRVTLTALQKAVLRCLVSGHTSTQELTKALNEQGMHFSAGHIKNELSAVGDVLNCHGRAKLVCFVLRTPALMKYIYDVDRGVELKTYANPC